MNIISIFLDIKYKDIKDTSKGENYDKKIKC